VQIDEWRREDGSGQDRDNRIVEVSIANNPGRAQWDIICGTRMDAERDAGFDQNDIEGVISAAGAIPEKAIACQLLHYEPIHNFSKEGGETWPIELFCQVIINQE
jgi:hypothetical protein